MSDKIKLTMINEGIGIPPKANDVIGMYPPPKPQQPQPTQQPQNDNKDKNSTKGTKTSKR